MHWAKTINTLDFQSFVAQARADFEPRFAQLLQNRSPDSRLQAAIEYAALGGGKRLRPLLVLASANAVNTPAYNREDATNGNAPAPTMYSNAALAAAAAVESIHAYSLVHDDLPAMDDDALRRGQPTCHIQFNEATAILAGDALQCLAFELLTECDHPAALAMTKVLAAAAGGNGMVGGQALDIAAVGKQLSLEQLRTMHQFKTGALINASVHLGALAGAASETQIAALKEYGAAVGLAFQVCDDILDIEASTEQLGKTQGADIALNKPTYPALMGLDSAKHYAQQLYQRALDALADFDHRADTLRQLSNYAITRDH